MIDASSAIDKIGQAVKPLDLFDADPGKAKSQYRLFQRTLHPDRNLSNPDAAQAYARLTELWGEYSCPVPDVVHGDIADLFLRPDGLLKLPRQHQDNDLMTREAVALKAFASDPWDNPGLKVFFPRLVASQRQRDPATRIIRRANLLVPLDGFWSLTEVRKHYPGGVHPRDAAWMWRRLLAALGAAHRAGFIHGAVLPPHIMIHPERHGLALIDWCYSAGKDQKIPAVVSKYRDWYPHEVTGKRTPVAATDICMAACTMKDLMGSLIPRRLDAFAKGCMLASRRSRPDDAWALLREFDELLERVFGPPEFHPFTMPVRA